MVPILEGRLCRLVIRDQKDNVCRPVGPNYPMYGSPCSHLGSQSPHLPVSPPLENVNHLSSGASAGATRGSSGRGWDLISAAPSDISALNNISRINIAGSQQYQVIGKGVLWPLG